MKIIVSHDVDHLYRNDHYRDLVYPKHWVRTTMNLLRGNINFSGWIKRMLNPFCKRQHHVYEVMDFDSQHLIPSSFFFGMEKGLGMSYGYEKAAEIIKEVDDRGFDVGVHGISYDSLEHMMYERKLFEKIINRQDFGIRMHYVRYNENTFEMLAKCGYTFDTTEFHKVNLYTIKNPYKVGDMWEFPLTIMDSYLPKPLEEKKERTLELIKLAEKSGQAYLSILFHDYYFTERFEEDFEWYKWVMTWLTENGYEFISYRDAICELSQ